jgi:chromosome segregation ATPase
MLAQIPTPAHGAIESWLITAAAIASLVLLGKKLFIRKPPLEAEFVSKAEFRAFRENVQHELDGLRDKIDARFLNLTEKIEEMKGELLAAGERRGNSIHRRISDLESGVARLDERTKRAGGRNDE